MATIIIATPLRKFAANQAKFETEASTIRDSIQNLAESHPDIKRHLIDDAGDIRKFLKIYVGDEDIQSLNGEETAIESQTVVSIIPAIAGGIQ